jgi:hypothetical protein
LGLEEEVVDLLEEEEGEAEGGEEEAEDRVDEISRSVTLVRLRG